mgnify:CR=1 FL=1
MEFHAKEQLPGLLDWMRQQMKACGGKTAVMIFDGKKVNTPADGGRKISDIVYIGEVAE